MPIYKGSGSNLGSIYFGGSSLGKVYLGQDLVWQKPGGDSFIFTVTVQEYDEIMLPLPTGYSYNFTVDWGDGTTPGTVTTYDDDDTYHYYELAGTYDIKITGTCQAFKVNNTMYGKQLITKIKS